jgi:capsular exopolysaccharide synthesis family protein
MSDMIPRGERIPPASLNGENGRGPVYGYAAAGEPEEETIDLREVLGVLRRNLVLIGVVTIAVLGATAFLVLRQAPQYRAEAMIRLLDERSALAGGLGGAAAEAMGRTNDPLLSQLQVLRSRAVAGGVVDRVGLRLRPVNGDLPPAALAFAEVDPRVAADTLTLRFEEEGYTARSRSGETARGAYGDTLSLAGVRFALGGRPEVEEARLAVRDRERAIDWVLENLRANPRDRTDVVAVQFTAGDPAVAQRVVNVAVEEFAARNARAARQQSQRRREFVAEQLAQTDSALAQAQLELTSFQQREGVHSSQQLAAARQTGLMELDMRRQELDADRRMLESLLGALERGGGARELRTLVSAPGVAQNPVIEQEYRQLARLEASRDSLVTGEWGSAQSNPDVQRLNALVSASRARLVDAVRSHVGSLRARVAALDELKARSDAELRALPASGAEEIHLVQRVETIRRIADQLREEYQRARIAEAVEAGQVEIVDHAGVPAAPIGSGRGMKLALGLMLGLMLGSGGAFVKEHLNSSIRRKEDIEGLLRVPGLAVIPQIAGNGAAQKRLRLPGTRPGGPAGRSLPGGAPGAGLVTVGDLHASSSEAYRTLRTNLIFSQAVQTLKTLVVTSSSPAEGKTTTAANLAVTFAQQGLRVLVVDCDLRRAFLHTVFGVEREPGLTQLVMRLESPERAIRSTTVPGLFVLPAGTLPPNPSELLGGERMREVLGELRAEFDVVMLDTPPLLAASDAAVLGKLADGVLLVLRAGSTDRGAAQHAMAQLRTVGAHVVGAVLNDPDAKVPSYGGGYYYHSYYGEATSA